MSPATPSQFSGVVAALHDRRLPEPATPAGYSALIDAFGLKVPIPAALYATGARHKRVEGEGWILLSPRHAPAATLEGHLVFALKYEGVDLLVLRRLFERVGQVAIAAIIAETPTGRYGRRIWFLYEWLRGEQLPLADLARGSYVDALDAELQWAGQPRNSPRHRVRNNLPGTPAFCPLMRRSPTLEHFVALDLAARARAVTAAVPADVLARTAAFLLLKDSRASYIIEGEHPPQDRIERWGRAIGQAGRNPIDVAELLRLQKLVIGDARFVRLGLRTVGGFIGEHDREQRTPLPDHISAKPQDLPLLIEGMCRFADTYAVALDPVLAATVLAFGFVFVHPFEDGNGRLHRYLLHHVLAARGFNPPGVVFPVSAAILARLDDYRRALEAYSKAVLPLIDWRATADGNVEVLSDTIDFYRYFDATPQAEFLYACVHQTVEEDLPREAAFLRRYDRFRASVQAVVDMPDRAVDLLFRMLQQNEGRLSKRATDHEFASLTPAEVERIQMDYADCFVN